MPSKRTKTASLPGLTMKLRQKGLWQIDQAPKRHTAAVYNGKSNTSGTEKGSQGALEANIRAVAAVEDALRQQEINDMANAARTSAIQNTAGAFAAHAGHLLSPFVSDSDEGGAGMGGSSGGERTLTPLQKTMFLSTIHGTLFAISCSLSALTSCLRRRDSLILK